MVLLIGIPSAVGLSLLASPLLVTLFNFGDFGTADVKMASLSLMAYAAGLPAFMLVKVLAPAFYSRKDTATPVRIAIVALLTNVVFNLLFVIPMVMLDIPGPHAGLALATSVAAWVNAGLLFHLLRKRQVYQPQPGWSRLSLQIGCAALVLGAVLVLGIPSLQAWQVWSVWSRVAGLLEWVLAGTVAYFLVLYLCGLRIRTLMQQRPHEG
jgi:putative peptidoglycan lipid II flippase